MLAWFFFAAAGLNAFAASFCAGMCASSALYSANVGLCVACFGMGIYFSLRD